MPKYTPQSYIDCNCYGGANDEIENYTEKVVKCRKEHDCVCGCEKKIPAGEYALCEKGFVDGSPVSIYTACSCIDRRIEELGGVEAGFDLWEENNG